MNIFQFAILAAKLESHQDGYGELQRWKADIAQRLMWYNVLHGPTLNPLACIEDPF